MASKDSCGTVSVILRGSPKRRAPQDDVRGVGTARKTGYACAASADFEDTRLKPDNDHAPRAVRRVRAERRAGCHHLAGAALAAEARRVPADAVAAGQCAARRSARRAVSGRVVSVLSSGQRHRARRAVQSRLQCRGAGFPARSQRQRRRVRRCRRQCRHLCAGAGASRRHRWQGDRDRAASGDACAAEIQPRRIRRHPGDTGGRGRGSCRRRIADRDRRRQSRRQPHRDRPACRQCPQGAGAAAAAHPR